VFTAHLYARVRIFLCAIAHETAGAARTRHSLLPLFERGTTNLEKLGQNPAARMRTLVFPRHCERSEAIHSATSREMDCFVEAVIRRCFAPTMLLEGPPSHHRGVFLLHFLDQFLAHHHTPPRHQKEHRRGAGDRQGEDRRR
jgi:hypothetical protein